MLEIYEIIILVLFIITIILSTIYLAILIKYAKKRKQAYKENIEKICKINNVLISINNSEIQLAKIEYNEALNKYFATVELEHKLERKDFSLQPLRTAIKTTEHLSNELDLWEKITGNLKKAEGVI